MASEPLIDIFKMDLNALHMGVEQIEAINPHRGDIRMLDGVVWADEGWAHGVAFKDVTHDEFWVPCHIPGRPIFPGVLMLEAAAQMASLMTKKRMPEIEFLGFIGVDDCRFRGQVVPGDRLYILIKEKSLKPRRAVTYTQGWVGEKLVFEAEITGMPI